MENRVRPESSFVARLWEGDMPTSFAELLDAIERTGSHTADGEGFAVSVADTETSDELLDKSLMTSETTNALPAILLSVDDGATVDCPGTIPVGIVGWEQAFAECDGYFFGREPSEVARVAVRYWKLLHPDVAKSDSRLADGEATKFSVPARSVIDLGCGDGRDSVFYAQSGFEVTAVDGSASALKKAESLAAEASVTDKVQFFERDLLTYVLAQEYPIVHACNCLQFLGAECLNYLAYLQRRTPVGGYHAISVMTNERTPDSPDLYRFAHNELRNCYDGWRVLSYAEETIWNPRVAGYLSFARIVAVRE